MELTTAGSFPVGCTCVAKSRGRASRGCSNKSNDPFTKNETNTVIIDFCIFKILVVLACI